MVLGLPLHGNNARGAFSVFRVPDRRGGAGLLAVQLPAILGLAVLHKDRTVGVLLDRAGAAQVLQIAESSLVALDAAAADLAQLHDDDVHPHGCHLEPPGDLADALVLGLARVGGA